MGYNTPAKIIFKKCKLINSNIGKHFGGNDAIEIWDSEITDTILSMSWSSDSISLFNSEVINSRFYADIDGFFHIDSCTIIGSEFHGFITEVSIMNSKVENSSFFLYSHLKISNSDVFLTYEDPVNFSRDHHIRTKSVEFIDTQFDGNNLGKDGVFIVGSKKSVIKNCNFNNYRKAILFEGTSLEVNTNNFSDIDEYVIENLTPNSINAKENYWGTINEDTIGLKIYDRQDNDSRGIVDFSNFLKYSTFVDVISSPNNVLKGDLGQKTLITWEENKESTLEGYKIYKKSIISNDFVLIADVGNVNSFEEILDIEEEIYIMAYAIDTAMDTKGQIIESKFSEPAKEFFEIDYISSTSLCKGAQILASISENYEFAFENYFTLQLSSVADSFANPIILDTVSVDQDILTSFLPDTLQFGEPYLVRVISSDLGIYSQPVELIYCDLLNPEFKIIEKTCSSDTITLKSVAQLKEGISYVWELDGGEILENQSDTLIKVTWNTPGEKSLSLSVNNHNCISDTTIKISVTPEPVIPEICLVTVDETTSNNMLVWSYDMETVDKFGIYRETNTANEYNFIEYIDGGQFNTYIDEQSVPDQISNRYKITAVDSCGTETKLSDFHKTIHLTINKGLENSWNLIWDSYEGFTFGTYNIYRSINDGEFELLKEVASNLTSYTDKNVVANSVAYQIEVVNPNGCGESSNGRILQYTSSKSNVARIGAVTGIEDDLLDNIVSISPNPTSNFIHIDFNKTLSGNYSVTNLAGKKVWEGNFDSSFRINLRDYKSGIYFLKIMTADGSIVKKILKD